MGIKEMREEDEIRIENGKMKGRIWGNRKELAWKQDEIETNRM